MKLVILGYMGSGKSAISKAICEQLNYRRIDLDDYIEEKEGSTITEIFSTQGEVYFRTLETSCLKELLNSEDDFVLSLGGGTPCFGNNMEFINEKSISIYLNASIPVLTQRLLPEKNKRPLIARITDKELPTFIGKHLFERRPFYLQAKIKATVDDKPVKKIAQEIISNLESHL